MNPMLQCKPTILPLFIAGVLACFGLLPRAQAVSPPPPGGYPNFTTAAGDHALQALTLGLGNTGIGTFSLFSVTTGNFNTAVGAGALDLNTADSNTATGAAALLFNTTGTENTANGAAALELNETGSNNTASGAFALFSNTTGERNTATGAGALRFSTSDQNTAFGAAALLFNTFGFGNTAVGAAALLSNTGATVDTPNGGPGSANTAVGVSALSSNTTGAFNTAVGANALANSLGLGNVALGSGAGSNVTTASDVICIAAGGANVNNSCFIGNIYSNVQPIVGTDPDSVTIDSNGRLGRGNVSSRRYKHDIKPMEKASEALYAFKPVSFRYNKEYDATQTLAFGLIAEEVAEVAPDLVGRNPDGQPESVRYEQVNAMLLNEFIKEHRKVEEQQATITQLKAELQATATRQQKQIEALSAGLQKVSAQLELNKLAPQTVKNNQ
jgi:Chaperone of endosialidase